MAHMEKPEKIRIGWRERVDLPDWEILDLDAKMDTGARTCSLDVEEIEELPGGRIAFYVVLDRASPQNIRVVSQVTKRGQVRSSSGESSARYFVKTILRIGEVEKEVEVSLLERAKMNYRMLVGRSALRGDFLVDAGRTNLLRKRKIKG